MSKTIRGLPDWANLSLKLLFVMIFPLTVQGTNLLEFISLPTSGLLFTPLASTVWVSNFSTLVLVLSTVLRNAFFGILVAFPGIYYSYKLSRVPVNRSYWKQGLGSAIAIYFLTFGFLTYLATSMYFPVYFWDFSLWLFLQRIGGYTTLVIGVFIILPLVQRQAVIIGSPSDLHDYSMREIESNTKLNLSREKMLSAIFWFILCFGPMMISQQLFFIGSGGITYASLLITYMQNISMHRDSLLISSFTCIVNDFSIIPISALIGAFHFAFVRDTYRYLRKTITRQRLLSMAVFSSIFPLILAIGMTVPFLGFYYYAMPIPLPFLQIVGFILVKYHRPIADHADRIWKDDKSRMWWEPDRKEQQRKEPVESTPERPYRHREELVVVPVTYLLISRIRQLKRRLRNSN